MSATRYPFQMAGCVPVVLAPAEIDLTTVGQLRAILLDWHSRGHATVVVDMTDTQFCDCAGLRELVLAHNRAVRDGGGLRLVIPAGGVVLRIFTVTGLDRLIPRFDALDKALAQVPAVTGRPLRLGSHLGPAATAGPPPNTVISACTSQGSSAHAPQPPGTARDAVMAGLVGGEPAGDDIAPLRYRRRPPGER